MSRRRVSQVAAGRDAYAIVARVIPRSGVAGVQGSRARTLVHQAIRGLAQVKAVRARS